MRLAVIFSTALILSGCSQDSTQQSPTVPSPPVETAPQLVNLRGVVVSPGGNCIEGALVEVVSGQAVGQKVMQSTPCDAWDDYFSGGFIFKDLTPDVAMTLRASAPGWGTQEKNAVPFLGPGPTLAVVIGLVQGG
jgi:hypothetical protein